MDSHKSDKLRKIAGEVYSLIRTNGLKQFRDQTRQAASEYVDASKKCKSRQEQRLELLIKNSVLQGVEDLPDQPDDDKTKWVAWKMPIRGRLKEPIDFELPPQRPVVPDEFDPFPPGELDDKQQERLDSFNSQLNDWKQANDKYWLNKSTKESRLADFRLIKERGFPNETIPENTKRYFEYDFEVQCWIPVELSPALDPDLDLPLPVPDRILTLAEKFAGLSALYDAHWKGGTKIAPWGTMPGGAEVVSGLPHCGVEEDQSHQASWYYWLVQNAKELDVKDMPIVERWLADVESTLDALSDDNKQEGDCQYLDITFGDREASRIVNGKKLGPVVFGDFIRPWELFRRLVSARASGVDKPDLADEFGSSLYHHKKTMLDIIMQELRLDVDGGKTWILVSLK